MNDISEIRDTVKRVVKSLLVASKHGMSERGINKEYVEIEGKRLPCGPLGFSCAEDLLRSFSDILNFRRRGALIIYTCKEADTDEHVRRMVKEQKNIPSKIRHGNTSSNSHGYGYASTKGDRGSFVPAEVQNNVMSILKENNEWMNLKSFCNVYKQKFGSLPSVGNLGFESMEFLLERMRGIVNTKSMDGTLYIAAVNKEKAQESWNIKEGKYVQSCLDKKYEHDKLNIEKSNIKHVPDCVINAMKILTQENPEGIRVELLIPFYKNLTGEDLNVYSLGYSSVLELVLSLGSIFKINTTRSNDYFVTPVEVTGNKKELSSMAKTRLKSLLKFKSSGISPEQLLALYKQEYPGKVEGDLDWNTLGYKGCFDLLQAQTDSVLQIQFAPNGPLIFPPVSLLDGSQPILSNMAASNKPLAQNTKIELTIVSGETKVSGDKINKFVQIGERFKQVNVREAHEKDEWFEIEVAEVYSPHLFWAHLRENSKNLNNLMDKMMEFYARPEVLENYRISSKDCSLEMPIVSFYEEDNNFYRAIVTNFKSFDKVEVFYVDWGTNAQVHRRNLWYLDRQFFDFPAQAIQARLSGIAPSHHGHRWINGTSKRFLQLVENRPLCAKIAGIKGSALEVELVDTTSDECDVYINERLVQEQYAIGQEKPQVVSQNSTPTQSECMQKQNCDGEELNVSDINQNDGESYKNDIQLLQEKLQNVNIIEKTEMKITGQTKNHKQEIENLSFEQQKQGLTQRYEKKQNKNNQQQEQYQQQQEHRQQLPKQEHGHHQLSLTEECKDESLQKIMAHNQWLHSELLKSRNALMTLHQKREDNKEEIDVNFGSEEKQQVIKDTEKLCDESKNTMDIQDSVFTEEQLVKIRDSASANIPSTSSIEQDTCNAINGCIDQLAKKRSTVLLKLCEEPESDVWLNMVKDINEKIKKLKIFKENI